MREVRVASLAFAALATLALVGAVGCYQPRLPSCEITCAADGFCPGDLTCAANNLCGAAPADCGGVSIDAAAPDAADELDAAPPDGPPEAAVWASLSVGSYHACAIDRAGALWCWGNNDLRQLGRDTPTRSATPLRVDAGGPADWASVSAGQRHTCAIRDDGTLWCWGINDDRQCGVAATSFVAPSRVADAPALSGTRWTAVTAGAFFTCGVRDDGTLWCFGTSDAGQLGQGVIEDQSAVPLRVGDGSDWRTVDAGLYHLCGLRGAVAAPGALECWGYDPASGRIGDGGNVSRYQPTPVSDGGAIDWRALSVGDYGACALDDAGALYCWGDRYQQPGNLDADVPTRYLALTGVTDISVGGNGGCLVAAGNVVRCWGGNEHGELGRAPRDGAVDPIAVDGLGVSVEVGAGNGFGCALDDAGAIRCWGDNGDGALGDGVIGDPREPVEVIGDHHPWRQVDVGVDHTCAVTEAGELYCWGIHTAGQLGSPSTAEALSATPVEVGDGTTWQRVVGGGRHSCALTDAGALYCWGANDVGQRGVGIATPSATPMLVESTTLSTLSTGVDSSCGVRTGGGARACWGQNDQTQLGNNSSDGQVATPTDLAFTTPAWARMAMGVYFGCGIGAGAAAGVLYCWGENQAGQVADDPEVSDPVITPRQVPDPTPSTADGWIDVATGLDHACGILAVDLGPSGSLYCWGHNGSAQLGDTAPGSHLLRQVGSLSDWTAVDVGSAHTCALRSTGALHCFGFNGSGQLGDGTAANSPGGAAIGGASDWVAMSAGNRSSCGIRGPERRLFCWGENRFGQLGTGESVRWVPAPVVVP